MSTITSSTVDTPVGPFTMLAAADGALVAAGWTDDHGRLVPLVHPTLRGRITAGADHTPAVVAVRKYFDGDLWAPSTVPVRQYTDGAFLAAAWALLRKVEPGEPVSYRELANRAGRPDAIRAAASACARNAIALFVPCHRVLRSGGGLGGFRWGLDTKRWLLAHERANRANR